MPPHKLTMGHPAVGSSVAFSMKFQGLLTVRRLGKCHSHKKHLALYSNDCCNDCFWNGTKYSSFTKLLLAKLSARASFHQIYRSWT